MPLPHEQQYIQATWLASLWMRICPEDRGRAALAGHRSGPYPGRRGREAPLRNHRSLVQGNPDGQRQGPRPRQPEDGKRGMRDLSRPVCTAPPPLAAGTVRWARNDAEAGPEGPGHSFARWITPITWGGIENREMCKRLARRRPKPRYRRQLPGRVSPRPA